MKEIIQKWYQCETCKQVYENKIWAQRCEADCFSKASLKRYEEQQTFKGSFFN